MGEVEIVGTVELVCIGRLLRMGCDSFLMPVCGPVGGGKPLWEQNGLPWEHSAPEQALRSNKKEEEREILTF